MGMDNNTPMGKDEKDVKPDVSKDAYVTLKVMAQDGSEISFRIKRHTQLKKLMATFCSRTGMDPALVRFQFCGERILDTDTPGKLGMDESDSIDVFQNQIAGHF